MHQHAGFAPPDTFKNSLSFRLSNTLTNYIALAALKALGDFLQHIFMMGLQPKTSAVCIFSGLTTIYLS